MSSYGLIAGENIRLTRLLPYLTAVTIHVNLPPQDATSTAAEPIAALLLCDADGASAGPDSLILFTNLRAPVAAELPENGPALEAVDIDLTAVPANVARIRVLAFTDPDVRHRHPALPAQLSVSVHGGGEQLAHFHPDTGPRASAVILAELYRHRDEWKVRALGDPIDGGFPELQRRAGIEL